MPSAIVTEYYLYITNLINIMQLWKAWDSALSFHISCERFKTKAFWKGKWQILRQSFLKTTIELLKKNILKGNSGCEELSLFWKWKTFSLKKLRYSSVTTIFTHIFLSFSLPWIGTRHLYSDLLFLKASEAFIS